MAYGADVIAKSDKDRRAPQLVSTLTKLTKFVSSENIAEDLLNQEDGESKLDKIGYDVEREYKIDKTSRADWETSATKAMDVALQVRQPKNYPFENAANIKYPLVTVAALQFGARAYPAIIDGNRVVKCQVIGSDEGVPATGPDGQPVMGQGPDGQPQPQWQIPPGAKKERADRISEHMSYQLLNEMEEWEEDTDVLLHHIPIIGCAFRKVWRSEELQRNKAIMIPAIKLVVNQNTRSLDSSPRVTHVLDDVYPQDIEEKQRAGIWLDIDLPAPTNSGEDEDFPHEFLEQHRLLDLDEDGYREPYIVTVHKESCKVVRIVANFKMEDVKYNEKRITRIAKSQYFVKYTFIPDPKGGFYDIGFGRLLESLSEAIDTTFNQILDAGHLSVAGGGFVGSGLRFKKNKITVSPGKYEVVGTTGKISDQIHAHKFPEPSAVLFQLLGMMIEAAKDITAVKDILTGDTGNKGVQTATTTLALIEQGLKVFTAIYKRIYRALKREFKLLFLLNAQFLDDKSYYTVLDQQKAVAKSDYDPKSMDVMPVADPKMVTDMQRGAQAQLLMTIAEHPTLGPQQNPREALSRIYDNVGMPDKDALLVPEPQGPSEQEQLAKAAAVAQINKDNAAAKKSESGAVRDIAEAEKTKVEAELAPSIAAHTGHMQENKARVDAAALEHTNQVDADAADRAERELAQKAIDAERKFEADKAKAQEKAGETV